MARNFFIMQNNQPQILLQLIPLQKGIQKSKEATGNLIGNKIANKVKKI